jgi:RimJ/RimL family protein N-acetyltransferase
MKYRLILDHPKVIGNWVYARTGGTFPENICTAIGLAKDSKIVAGVVYEGFNGASVKTHIAIDDKEYLTKDFIRIIFQYPFLQLKCKKLIGIVDSSNAAALRLNEKLGFVKEGELKGASLTGDLVLMTMTKEQCKYLGKPK